MRNSFIFFSSYYDATRKLPKKERASIYLAIIEYAIDGIEPSGLSLNGEMCFKLIKPTIDAGLLRYDTNVENGKKGGAPKGNTNAKKADKNQPKNNPETTQIQPKNNPKSTENQPKINLNIDIDKDIDTDKEMDKENDLDGDICVCSNELEYIESTSNTDTSVNEGDEVAEHTPMPPIKKFIKPTVLEVQKYCEERGNQVDPQRFCDFYESKGWQVGNTPMRDWQACVRNWEQNEVRRAERSQYQEKSSNIFLEMLKEM